MSKKSKRERHANNVGWAKALRYWDRQKEKYKRLQRRRIVKRIAYGVIAAAFLIPVIAMLIEVIVG